MKLTDEKLETIERRLKKLMALTLSPVEAEAKLAGEKMAEIMEKYNITTIDVDEETNEVETAKIEVEGLTNRRQKWEHTLGAILSEAFDCKEVAWPGRWDAPWKICIIGTKHDVKLVHHYHITLRRKISFMTKEFIQKSGNDGHHHANLKKNYCYGILNTLTKRLREMKEYREQIRKTDTTALIVIKDQAVVERFNSEFPRVRSGGKQNLNGSREAFTQGLTDGKKISLNRPIKGNQSRRIMEV